MRVLAIIAFLLGTAVTSLALSYGTPNSMAAQAMASRMDYSRETGGKVPETWEEMDALFARPMDDAFSYVLPTRRYAFVTNDIRIADSRLLLMMRSPFRDVRLYTAWYGGIARGVRERGRWVILQDSQSVIRARYVAENLVTAAFARAGVSLPMPDGLEEWPHEVEYRHSRITKTVVSSVILSVAVAVLFNRIRRRTRLCSEPVLSVSVL
jgi:hypothetical protein